MLNRRLIRVPCGLGAIGDGMRTTIATSGTMVIGAIKQMR